MLDHGDMASPMFVTPAADYESLTECDPCQEVTMKEHPEPKNVPMPESLQEFASRTWWASNDLMPGPFPAYDRNWDILSPPGLMPDDACWSMSLPPGLIPDDSYWSTAHPLGLLPAALGGDDHAQNSEYLQQNQEEIGIDFMGTLHDSIAETAIECEPAHKELGMEVARLSLKQSARSNRWWTMPRYPMVCPFSGFPVNLLPYPPFKLRHKAADPNPHSLVDGKYFALLLISSGSLNVDGRSLEKYEVDALGKHIHRCKLGPYRPAVALSLAEKAQDESLTESQRAEAKQALGKMRTAARCELGKMRWIQEQRLFKLHEKLTLNSDGVAAKKAYRPEGAEKNRKSVKTTKDKKERNKTHSDLSVSTQSTLSLSSGVTSSDSEDN